MYKYFFFFFAFTGIAVISCAPERDDEFQLPPSPDAPQFTVEMVAGDSNRMVIHDLSDGNFQKKTSLKITCLCFPSVKSAIHTVRQESAQ